jgi:hypothetical protein
MKAKQVVVIFLVLAMALLAGCTMFFKEDPTTLTVEWYVSGYSLREVGLTQTVSGSVVPYWEESNLYVTYGSSRRFEIPSGNFYFYYAGSDTAYNRVNKSTQSYNFSDGESYTIRITGISSANAGLIFYQN